MPVTKTRTKTRAFLLLRYSSPTPHPTPSHPTHPPTLPPTRCTLRCRAAVLIPSVLFADEKLMYGESDDNVELPPCVFSDKSPWLGKWDLTIMLLLLYVAIITPMEVPPPRLPLPPHPRNPTHPLPHSAAAASSSKGRLWLVCMQQSSR